MGDFADDIEREIELRDFYNDINEEEEEQSKMNKEFKTGAIIKIDDKYRNSIYHQLFEINALENTLTDISKQIKLRRDLLWKLLYGILPEGLNEYHLSINHESLEITVAGKFNEFELNAQKLNRKILDFIEKAEKSRILDNS